MTILIDDADKKKMGETFYKLFVVCFYESINTWDKKVILEETQHFVKIFMHLNTKL